MSVSFEFILKTEQWDMHLMISGHTFCRNYTRLFSVCNVQLSTLNVCLRHFLMPRAMYIKRENFGFDVIYMKLELS